LRRSDPGRPPRRRLPLRALVSIAVVGAAGCSTQHLVVVDPEVRDGGDAAVAQDAADTPVVIQPGLLDGIVGYWRLDDGAGSASARDGSGRNNNGVLVGLSSATAWVPGHAATGLAIAATGWVVVPPSASIDAITDQLTIAGWIYLDGTVMNYGTLLSRQIGSTIEQHYHLSLNADRRPNVFVTTGAKTVILTAPVQVGQRSWVHLAATYDGHDARLFVGGVQVANMPITGTFDPDTTPIILGGNVNAANGVPDELFPGRVDEIMLYKRALSADEIVRLYNGELFATTMTDHDQ
jgi:hypothetical protein